MAKKKNGRTYTGNSDERVISEEFDHSRKFAKQAFNGGSPEKTYNLRGEVLRRRKAAALTYLPRIKERYEDDGAEFDVVREWARHSSLSCYSINNEDKVRHFTLAAAIWMLDELKHRGRLKDAFRYFYKEPDELESIYLPSIFDAWHDDSVLRSMMYLIIHRDEYNEPGKCYINEITAKRTTPVVYEVPGGEEAETSLGELDMGPRERFNAIMALIHPEVKRRAVDRFVAKQWEYLDGLFACSKRYAIECASLEREIDRLSAEGEALDQKLKALRRKPASQIAKPKGPFAVQIPLAYNLPNIQANGLPNFNQDNAVEDTIDKLKRIATRGLSLQEKLDDLDLKHNGVLIFSPAVSLYDRADLERDLGSEVLDRLLQFEVDDPYETCFAFLCLIESGSDSAWLYNANMAVLMAAARKLPWTPELFMGNPFEWDGEESEDFEEYEDDADDNSREENIGDLTAVPGPPLDWIQKKAQLYKLKYKDVQFFSMRKEGMDDRKLNLPQIIYALTGLVMPRTVSDFDETAEELVEAGMDPAAAAIAEMYTQLASDVQYPSKDWEAFLQSSRFQWIYEQYGEEELEEDAEEALEDEIDVDALRDQIRALKEKNDELRKRLYTATKEAEQKQAEAKRILNETAIEHQELLDLRELVFNRVNQEALSDEEGGEVKVELPYHTTKRMVVFGGHDSWLKAIKPLLPDVVFVNRGQNPNAEMIRAADIVWIQANALSHKDYYKIINIVRTNRIPVRYFGYASARKCAEQLAIEDMKER